MSFKKADPKNRPGAKKVAQDCKVNTVYVNSKGERFTSENAALNSDKKENIEVHDFTAAEPAETAGVKLYKLTKANMTKNDELAVNGWAEGDEVESLDFAIKNKKPAAQEPDK